ncbi:MAG: hypothetical protein GTO45_02665 [Candidatus Aminicenantes bacterium]|nr:hypothetical protein [Candidatus Aminicenantes bacterium]NIM77635.1 hypothetical protein [Candidatus Aminicenantes bacterium]NIN83644.1 hypothetical protein [Candidatus Aminicenantes bacterium]NIO79539.1 hypothetical protein [Candidatus Aminicenantes bacterium]NIQ65494.1 hypothetical protein [Candidatus Aminicenantes bacterium]
MFLVDGEGLHSQLSQYNDIESLKKQITVLGMLPFKQDIPIHYMSKTRLQEYLAVRFDADYPDKLSEKEGEFIWLMGFVERKIDVRRVRKQILLNNVGAWYNSKTKELLALYEYRDIDFIHAMVLTHELRHSILDQHFDLSALAGGHSDFDDRKLGVLAAIKGDTTFLMVQYSDMNADILLSSPDGDALFSYAPIIKPSLLYRKPIVLKYQLLMPYVEGLRFVNAVFKKKKWKGVNEILHDPPESTEQILHPDKYFKREKPVKVTIRYKPEGHELFHSGVIGEYYLKVLLKPKNSLFLRDYANGWGGDTFHIYKKPKNKQDASNSYFLAWESIWDRDKKVNYCSHFHTDFKRFIERRFNVNFKKGKVKGVNFIAGQSQSGEGYFFLVRLGYKVFYARSNNRKQMNTFIYGGHYD